MAHVAPVVPELPVSHAPHTRCGIASVALSIVVALLAAVLMVLAPDDAALTPAPLFVEIGAWLALVLAGAGAILGIVGAFQQDVVRLFGFIGIGVNVVAVVVVGALMAIGAIAY